MTTPSRRGTHPVSASALVRAARSRAGITQHELAERAGVTQSVVSTYENGRREPSLAMLQRLLGGAGFAASIDLEPVGAAATLRQRVERARREIVRRCEALGAGAVYVVWGAGGAALPDGSEGAAAERAATEDAPVSLVVEPATVAGLFALMRMQDRVEALLGAPVAVASLDAYDPWDRATLLREAVRL